MKLLPIFVSNYIKKSYVFCDIGEAWLAPLLLGNSACDLISHQPRYNFIAKNNKIKLRPGSITRMSAYRKEKLGCMIDFLDMEQQYLCDFVNVRQVTTFGPVKLLMPGLQ